MTQRGDSRGRLAGLLGVGTGLLVLGAASLFWWPATRSQTARPNSSIAERPATGRSASAEPGPPAPAALARSDPLGLIDIAGSVVFEDGVPCRGGRVEIVAATGHRASCTTDDSGGFRLQSPRAETVAEIDVTAAGTVPLRQTVDVAALPSDAQGNHVLHLRALRRITVRVIVELDPSIADWIEPTHRIRLALRRASLVSPNGLENVGSARPQTVAIRGTRWPITFVADEDRLRGHRGWLVTCELATRWPVLWCEAPVTLATAGAEQSSASVRITLDASRVLRGTIASEDGHPLGSARLIFERSGLEAAFCYSEPGGRFLLPVPGNDGGRLLAEFGRMRTDLGLRSPGEDVGVVTVGVPECIRVRLIDEEKRPITTFFVGYSNLHRRPSQLESRITQHNDGIAVLRSSGLSPGDRLFFEGHFGQMVYDVGEQLSGSTTPIEIVAVPSPTGNLRIEGGALRATPASVELREARTARRYSDNLSYVASVAGETGVCEIQDIVIGDYQYAVQVAGVTVAEGYVQINEGDNVLTIR